MKRTSYKNLKRGDIIKIYNKKRGEKFLFKVIVNKVTVDKADTAIIIKNYNNENAEQVNTYILSSDMIFLLTADDYIMELL